MRFKRVGNVKTIFEGAFDEDTDDPRRLRDTRIYLKFHSIVSNSCPREIFIVLFRIYKKNWRAHLKLKSRRTISRESVHLDFFTDMHRDASARRIQFANVEKNDQDLFFYSGCKWVQRMLAAAATSRETSTNAESVFEFPRKLSSLAH